MRHFPNNYFKTVFLITSLFITKLSLGQKPAIGIKLGLAFSNATIKPVDAETNSFATSTRTGVLGGIFLDIPSGKKLIVRPGIEVVSKGTKEGNYPIRFTFVDFPLNILYKISNANGAFLAGGGPSIGVPITDYYSRYPLKIEYGVNGLIGYQLPIGFSFNLNYSYGLSNASNHNEFIRRISNRYLGIAVGYTF